MFMLYVTYAVSSLSYIKWPLNINSQNVMNDISLTSSSVAIYMNTRLSLLVSPRLLHIVGV